MREYIIVNPHNETHSITYYPNGEALHVYVNGPVAPAPTILSAETADSILTYCRNRPSEYTVTVQE